MRATSRRPLLALGVIIVASMAARVAHAQDADAEALFNEADTLESSGKIPEACDAFEASNRIEARAGTLIRLGQCREKQGKLASAWSAYKDALTRVKDPAKKQIAETRVAAIEPRISYLTVSVPDESRIDGLEITRNGKPLDAALWNRAAPVDGGEYVIGGKAPGHEEWSTKVTVKDEGDKVSVDVPRFKELRKLVDEPPPPPEQHAPVDHGGGMLTGRRKLALGVTGAGVVSVVIGGVLGAGVQGLKDQAFAICPDPMMPCPRSAEAQDKYDSARSHALYADIAYGVGGVAIAAGAVLWLTGKPSAEPRRVTVAPRVGGYSGVDVQVRF